MSTTDEEFTRATCYIAGAIARRDLSEADVSMTVECLLSHCGWDPWDLRLVRRQTLSGTRAHPDLTLLDGDHIVAIIEVKCSINVGGPELGKWSPIFGSVNGKGEPQVAATRKRHEQSGCPLPESEARHQATNGSDPARGGELQHAVAQLSSYCQCADDRLRSGALGIVTDGADYLMGSAEQLAESRRAADREHPQEDRTVAFDATRESLRDPGSAQRLREAFCSLRNG